MGVAHSSHYAQSQQVLPFPVEGQHLFGTPGNTFKPLQEMQSAVARVLQDNRAP